MGPPVGTGGPICRCQPVVVARTWRSRAGGVAVVSFGLHQHRPGKPQLSLRAYGMVGGRS
jgi:hypothetical protein